MIRRISDGQEYRVIYKAVEPSHWWAADIVAEGLTMNQTKLPVRTKTGTIHIMTAAGLLCSRSTATEAHSQPITARDLCGQCLRVLCAIWEPLAVPAYEPSPF